MNGCLYCSNVAKHVGVHGELLCVDCNNNHLYARIVFNDKWVESELNLAAPIIKGL